MLYKEPNPSLSAQYSKIQKAPKTKMKNMAISTWLCCFFVVLVLKSFPATSQEVDDEHEFNYDRESDKGPARWGELHPEWSLCKTGSMQSPIDLLNKRVEVVSHLGNLRRNYKCSPAILKNRGHDMMLSWDSGAGYLEINETKYVLNQCHWHSPSEHTINGKRLDMELHFVHESSDGKIAVVGVLYKIGRPDSFLSSLSNHLEDVAGTTEQEKAVGIVDPNGIQMDSRNYYRYLGSLTIPPCTQNVSWTVARKLRTVSREQIRLLRVAVHDDAETNARPLQPLNRRSVHLNRPRERTND